MSSFIMDDSNVSYKAPTPVHVLSFSDQVVCVEFSPYLWSHDLICVAFPDKIVVGTVKFQVSVLVRGCIK